MTNHDHIMFDLETLGTGDHAAIIQIGAVYFRTDVEEFKVISDLSCNIKLTSENLGNIEGGTLKWWLDQTEEAKEIVLNQKGAIPLHTALTDLSDWILKKVEGKPIMWANGALFDTRLLRHAYERCGIAYPISYRQEACFRTVRFLCDHLEMEKPKFIGEKHDALADSVFQAEGLFNFYKRLKND